MIKILKLLLGLVMIFHGLFASAQTPAAGKKSPKLQVYYFHPTERCPIDQSIEETVRKMMRTDFAK